MRKVTFLFALLFILTQAYASRIIGGDITAQHIGGNDYIVTLSVFGDALITSSAAVDVVDINGNTFLRLNCKYDAASFKKLANGTGAYIYSDTVTLPGPGTYAFYYSYCCRDVEVRNIINPGNDNILLKTIVTNDTISNSTPVFLTPPVFYLQQNAMWTYNPLPYDADGDSLHWSLTAPLNGDTIPIIGYFLPSSDSSDAISIDPFTSAVSWKPANCGNYAICLLVEEFRAGKKTGEVRRDMQLIVNSDSSVLPEISNMNSILSSIHGCPYSALTPGRSFSFSFKASTKDVLGAVQIFSYGEPFLNSLNEADFSTSCYKNNKNNLTVNVNWIPDKTQARKSPYFVVFRVSNENYSFDYTVALKVEKEAEMAQNPYFLVGDIYPNPVNSMIFLPVTVDKETKLSVHILDILGNQMWAMQEGNYDAGKHLLSGEINLPNGQYIAQVLKNGAVCKTQKIVIVR